MEHHLGTMYLRGREGLQPGKSNIVWLQPMAQKAAKPKKIEKGRKREEVEANYDDGGADEDDDVVMAMMMMVVMAMMVMVVVNLFGK
ncbi:hypothetical protein QZH41_005289, partial [Actinostola sp. cb2023]